MRLPLSKHPLFASVRSSLLCGVCDPIKRTLPASKTSDPQRGLDALILAANVREESRRKSRMYGMWFTDYLPYFRIAQAHSKLGNWRCAMDAMRLSARYSEFSPADSGYRDYSDLQKLILRHNPQSG